MTPERFAKLNAALDRRQPDLTVLMDSVNKSRNVSAVIRTADAVGLLRVHAIAMGAALRRHHLTAGGAKDWVGLVLHRTPEVALAALRAEGFRFVVADASPGARDFRTVEYTAKVCVVVGAELRGLSAEALAGADERVAIPMQGLCTSLNVSVAAGAILLEAQRQRAAAGFYETPRLSPEQRERTLFEWCYPDIAQRCRELGRAYPKLRTDGLLAENPLLHLG
jgi:tRNA (guanosine-2'-O-)-methyltransferase